MILVAGSSDELECQICFILASRGMAMRALVLNPSDAAWVECLKNHGATLALGDLRDPDFLADLYLGVNAVICSPIFLSTGQLDLKGMLSLITSAAAAGVPRFVYLSFMDKNNYPPAREKAKIEQQIIDSGIAYTILHAGRRASLMNGSGARSNRQAWIKDLARLAAQALQDPAQLNAVMDLGSPVDALDDPVTV